MALQGTLDTFALADVLRLLAATKKTGRLRIDAAIAGGSVWVDAGGVVGLDANRGGDTPVERLFELLRSTDGSFTFDGESPHPSPDVAVDVEPLLAEAEALLAEWRLIESVVPSLASWVSLVAELPAAQVTLDRNRWHTITTIAAGTTVADLGTALGLAEVPVSRVVKELVELGLASVTAAPANTITFSEPTVQTAPMLAPPVEPELAPAPEPAPIIDLAPAMPVAVEPALAPAPESSLPPAPWAEESLAIETDERFDSLLGSGAVDTESFESVFPGLAASAADAPDADLDADAVARQLANLSPRAAKAVRAAAAASTEAEREAALADMPEDADEPLNRGLLLKFLSSVRS